MCVIQSARGDYEFELTLPSWRREFEYKYAVVEMSSDGLNEVRVFFFFMSFFPLPLGAHSSTVNQSSWCELRTQILFCWCASLRFVIWDCRTQHPLQRLSRASFLAAWADLILWTGFHLGEWIHPQMQARQQPPSEGSPSYQQPSTLDSAVISQPCDAAVCWMCVLIAMWDR